MIEKKVPEATPADLPHFYFNGYQLSLGNADVTGLLMVNNAPVLSLSMSYTTAKSLQASINELVATLERITQHDIMTTKVVDERMKIELGKQQDKQEEKAK